MTSRFPLVARISAPLTMHTDLHTSERSSLSDDLARFIDEEVAARRDDPVAADTDLVMSGLVDSLGVVMIVDWIERRLAVKIDPADVVIENFVSVSAMLEYLAGRDDVRFGAAS